MILSWNFLFQKDSTNRRKHPLNYPLWRKKQQNKQVFILLKESEDIHQRYRRCTGGELPCQSLSVTAQLGVVHTKCAKQQIDYTKSKVFERQSTISVCKWSGDRDSLSKKPLWRCLSYLSWNVIVWDYFCHFNLNEREDFLFSAFAELLLKRVTKETVHEGQVGVNLLPQMLDTTL